MSLYFYELVRNLLKTEGIDVSISLLFSNNQYLNKTCLFHHRNFFPNKVFIGKNRILMYLNKIYSIKCLMFNKYDICHPTYYDPYFLKLINRKPFVLTVYDMIHERYPHLFTTPQNISLRKRLLIEKANKIIAISENTKNDILRYYNIKEEKIKVVHLACSVDNKQQDIYDIKFPDKYILYVGTRWGYKNFVTMLLSMRKLLLEDHDLYLICAGGGEFTQQEMNLIENLQLNNKILYYYLYSNAFSIYYKKALLFIFPSLYEGFGLPILEAFASGCPVVLSDNLVFKEIAGDAGIFFNPNDQESIKEVVSKVLYCDRLKEYARQKGYVQLKNFSWNKTTRKTLDVYKEII